ncbi:MAG: hypothetical protein B7X11_00540, partial [Acidobacteria bacterium 37-65-4]
ASAISILKAFPDASAEGTYPQASLVADAAGNLYGTAPAGGVSNGGTVFTVRKDGTGFVVLHRFTGRASDGGSPQAGLVLDGDGNLYGTTFEGGVWNHGTVFAIKTDGTGFAVLHSFADASDGVHPLAGLIVDGRGILYGTTDQGGVSNLGTVFTVRTDGTGFALLHSFMGGASDGVNPEGSLVLDGSGNLYGSTYGGGVSNGGTIFTIKADGSGFALLHSFTGGGADGDFPRGGLILDNAGNLYGTTESGGSGGTVFKVKTDGTGFALLHSFTFGASEGAGPYGGLILDDAGTLYGTTRTGGAWFCGTVFKVKTDGTGFATLHVFAVDGSDGMDPYAGLVLGDAGDLFGTTMLGGASDHGTVFTVTTDGTGYTILHSFAGVASDGANPHGDLVLDGADNLYGIAVQGGASDDGTVFTVKQDGTGFVVLHSFTSGASDGASPMAGLLLDGAGNVYGTTAGGGSGEGTVFAVRTDGTGFTILHRFTGGASDDGGPAGRLVLDKTDNLYGTTYGGSPSSGGTVFKVKTDGTGFALLHRFTGGASDGAHPTAGVIFDGDASLYGTTYFGGPSNQGTIFTVMTDGSGFTLLHSFAGASDGANPLGGLILGGDGSLYGTTDQGGASNLGTVFTVRTDGTGFTLLHSFASAIDGVNPNAGLVLDGAGNLYGTAAGGGVSGGGTLFTVRTDGTGFVVLHRFRGGASDGANPQTALILDRIGNLCGTTSGGGAWGIGTVFSLPVSGDRQEAPAFSSASSTTFPVGVPDAFTVATIGKPAPTITSTGALPGGVSLIDNGDGTATLAGTAVAGSAGAYSLTLTAHNGIGTDAIQSFALWVVPCTPPSIAVQPQGQAIRIGQIATLTVTATGTPPLTYQWYRGTSGDTSHPVGADTSSLTTPALNVTASYWVLVSNACGSADGHTATITVGPRLRRHLRRLD